MEGVRGRRKAVLFISEGLDYEIYNVFEARDATTVLGSVRDAIGAATRGNVAFYTVDPRGLTTMGDDAIEMTGFADDPSLGVGPEAFGEELRLSQDNLRMLADETGGIAAVNSNDFATAFDRVVRDNSSYYVLGYYPQNARRDGRYRRIEVRVNRPGLEVRSRKGYVAPRGKPEPRFTDNGADAETSAALREALNSPLPEPGLPLAVTVAPFKGAAPNASVLVAAHLGGRELRFAEKDGKFLNTIELSLIAVDSQGKIRNGDRSKVDLALSPPTYQAVRGAGFRLLSRIDLPPGRYQLRVAARESGGLVGAVPFDLEVPDFSKEPLSMSGLVLTSVSAAMTPTARQDEQLKGVLDGPPAVVRDFLRGDTLSLFTEIYDNEASTPHRVDIVTTVVGEDGRQVFKTEDERSSSELGGARGGYGYAAKVPLADVAPGRYLLRVEARSRLRGDQPVARETEIRVFEARRPQPQASATPALAGKVIVPVDRGPMSGVAAYTEVLARNEEEWTALWKSLPARRPMPRVTFGSTMVAGLFLGERPTPGFSVEFTGVKIDGDTLLIEYVERVPPADATVAQMVTTPYFVAGVPKHDGPVKFVKLEP
nr:VWA domain-containing protein [Vicinamibacterales bacterium]